ncbi:PLC-like phosphodiesterase [Cryphonectria parasitica EP155]|uniref:PLC-like phosphodiesterase n=1 Tax=Cryphonectria parasitica (strain ATCC 38755 / EP155) TaxID=660469 RepID=A0A9P4XXL5_CRYP1|nr:PLC-like phosphodiesterase [Cryphonectria parasitica EP155]KAF3762781.1 PLC-like phosphodiesterase [Cryphonectria parasitica EP155]
MPSKGVQAYTYIAAPGCSIELSVPGQTVVRNELRQFWNGDLEVESGKIHGLFNEKGKFTFKVLHNGKVITEQWIEVNALTGNASGGTMDTIAKTQSVLHKNPDVIVSYGFYESGQGYGLLPGRHQCYITVTPDFSGWMGSAAPPGSPQKDQPFRRFVLPAAHDVGMNSMQNCDVIIKHAGGAVVRTLLANDKTFARVLSEVTDKVSGPAVAALAPDIVSSLAITQKDPLQSMLALGARYFEFRPAFTHKEVRQYLPDKLYFQHSAIPGMAYDDFLNGVVQFLMDNPTEIVVVQLRWDGVPAACEHPSEQQLGDYLQAALRRGDGNPHKITTGNLDDLRNRTIGDIRHDGKRLIMLNSIDSISTYTDAGNATLNGDSIVAGFGQVLHPDCCGGRGFINIQCQATATNIPKAVAYSVLEAGSTSSCLLATKPTCDSKTLPWVRDNLLRACGRNDLVVVMNDFIDGATADVAVELSRQRLN